MADLERISTGRINFAGREMSRGLVAIHDSKTADIAGNPPSAERDDADTGHARRGRLGAIP